MKRWICTVLGRLKPSKIKVAQKTAFNVVYFQNEVTTGVDPSGFLPFRLGDE